MTFIDRATDAIKEAESTLRQLASEAVQSGEYISVGRLVELASGLAALLPQGRPSMPVVDAVQPETPTVRLPLETRLAIARRAKPTYPRFRRDGTALVKIGWSKTGRCEYEQRAPEGVLNALVQAAAASGRNGAVFTLEQLLPLADGDNRDTPTYQAYLCLAWLRLEGLVAQHGRRGYSLPNSLTLAEDIRTAWQRIPKVNHG